MKVKWNNMCILNKYWFPSLLAPSHPSNYTLPVFRLGLCSVLLESLSSMSTLLLVSLSDKKSLCWDKESLSEWLADGVSDLWLAGDDDLDGDSKNFLTAGWLKIIVSHVFDPCKNESKQNKLLIISTKSRQKFDLPKNPYLFPVLLKILQDHPTPIKWSPNSLMWPKSTKQKLENDK